MNNLLRLGVNIDHVATIRNARGGIHPDPLEAALQAEKGEPAHVLPLSLRVARDGHFLQRGRRRRAREGGGRRAAARRPHARRARTPLRLRALPDLPRRRQS